jgi:hypothetical protein
MIRAAPGVFALFMAAAGPAAVASVSVVGASYAPNSAK